MGRPVFAQYETFVDQVTLVHEGEAWDGDDPIVTANPHVFADAPPRVRTSHGAEPGGNYRPWAAVETATAAPGEVRAVTRPKGDN